jgi:hypothetical protein
VVRSQRARGARGAVGAGVCGFRVAGLARGVWFRGCMRSGLVPASYKTKQQAGGAGPWVPVSRRVGAGGHRGRSSNGGEFDPGSGSTLAACLMHASRTGILSGVLRGGRVRSTWATCPVVGASPRKRGVIPHELECRVGHLRKGFRTAAGGACARLVSWWGNGSPRR